MLSRTDMATVPATRRNTGMALKQARPIITLSMIMRSRMPRALSRLTALPRIPMRLPSRSGSIRERAFGRAAQRVAIVFALAHLAAILLHPLKQFPGKLLGAGPQVCQGLLLRCEGTIGIAIAQGFFSLAHGFTGTAHGFFAIAGQGVGRLGETLGQLPLGIGEGLGTLASTALVLGQRLRTVAGLGPLLLLTR